MYLYLYLYLYLYKVSRSGRVSPTDSRILLCVVLVFRVLNVGGVVAQEDQRSTVTGAGPTGPDATSAAWMAGEVNFSLCMH